ncbi:MAG: PAS domain S-box protein [Elainellaceae cyanobacterium]
MDDYDKPKAQLIDEIVVLRQRVAELECSNQDCSLQKHSLQEAHVALQRTIEERTEALRESNDQFIYEVAERKHTEVCLQESEAQYQSLTDVLPLCLYRRDRAGRLTFANPSFLDTVGMKTLRECLGMTVYDLYDPDLAQKYSADDEYVLQTGETLDIIEHRPMSSGGPDAYVHVVKTPVRDRQGTIIGTQGIFWDVTDRIQAEAELKTQKEFLSSIYDGVAEAIFVIDVLEDGRFQIAGINPANEAVIGLSSSDIQGKTPDEVFPPAAAASISQHYQDCLAAETKITYEECLSLRDQDNWWLTSLTPIRNEAGRIYRLIGTSVDITDRKRAEEAIRLQAEQERIIGGINLRIRRSLNLDEILNTAVEEVRQCFETDRVMVYQFNPDWSGQVIVESVSQDWLSVLGSKINDPCFGENYAHLYQHGRILNLANIHTADITPCHVEFLNQFQVKATLCVPILQGENLWGLLIAHHCRSPRHWQAFEVDLLQHLANNVAIAVHQSELYHQVQAELIERSRAEEALRAAKDQLEAVLDAVPGIVSWISSDLKYLGVNQHLAQFFQRSPDEFAGRDIGFLDSSDEFRTFVQTFFDSSARDTSTEITAHFNGTLHNFLIVAQKYDYDRAAFIVGIDISERRQAEDSLRIANDQLQAALDAVPGIVSWINRDLKYLGVNRHLAQTFNLPPDIFVGQDIGFLSTSSEFEDFIREFFASPARDNLREISAHINGLPRKFLITAQKYNQDQAVFVVGIDITDRHTAEVALRQAEFKYRTIFENAVEGIFQATIDGCYLDVNPTLAKIYGYDSPEELMSHPSSIQQLYVDPVRRSEFINLLQDQDAVYRFESPVYRKDGSVTWISENARAVRDRQGNLLYYEGTVEDITDRKQAEAALRQANEELEKRVEDRTAALRELNDRLVIEIAERHRAEAALRQSETELRALFAAMTDIVVVFDARGQYVNVLSNHAGVLTDSTNDLIGKTVYDVMPSAQAMLMVVHIQRALNTGETVFLEYSLPGQPDTPASISSDAHSATLKAPLHAAPHEIWFSASVSPMPDNCVIWVARDITQRKQAEQQLQQAEEKYRTIFENAAEGIYQITDDGRYLSANPALVRMYGYESIEDMVAHLTDIATKLHVDPSRRSELIALLQQHNAVSNFEAQVYRKDGSIIWTASNARAVHDEQGHLLYYEGTVQDITERKRAEIALQDEQQRSERLLLNILPRAITEQLKESPKLIANRFDNVTILFADIVDFTGLSSQIPPTELVDLLNDIFSNFDQLADYHQLEKIKTIGDAYMVVGGLPTPRHDHLEAIAEMALDMQQRIAYFQRDDGQPFQLRIGINTGPVVAGVIGIKKFTYDLWGDTVNVASRMETQGVQGRIQVTAHVHERLQDRYLFEKRGTLHVKGWGNMSTYWLIDRNNRPTR